MDHDIKIHFPLDVLKPTVDLIDPTNTETVWEYYLLENLSCGLVRDSGSAAVGYKGCLSERFYQENSKTWVFKLRELKWSDGSEVSPEEIKDWIQQLTVRKTRHLKLVRLIDTIHYDVPTRVLTLHFSKDTNDSILHEFSLADAGLVPPHYLTDGWKKTVGPYSVSSWSGLKEPLRLKANPYSPLYSPDMPRSASLFFIPNLKTSFDLFKKIPVDIVAQSAIGNPELISNLRQSAGQEYVAHPTTIFFFYFNDRNTEARDIKNRQAFAQVIYDYQQQSKVLLEEKYGWNLETQMVPEGFTGRLTSLPTSSESGVALPKKVEITIPDYFKDFPLFYTGLTSAFAKHNVELKIRFGGRKIDGNESLAGIYLFVGNQLDPSGSWSFLMTPPYGMLAPWLNDVRASFDAVFSGEQMDIRPQKLEQLHSEVLKDYLAIPFAVGSTRYFLSPRVDASRWNRFDSRLRIYELRWK